MLGFAHKTELTTPTHDTTRDGAPRDLHRRHDLTFISALRLGADGSPRGILCGAIPLDRAPRVAEVRHRHQGALPDGRAASHAGSRCAAGNGSALLAPRRSEGLLARSSIAPDRSAPRSDPVGICASRAAHLEDCPALKRLIVTLTASQAFERSVCADANAASRGRGCARSNPFRRPSVCTTKHQMAKLPTEATPVALANSQ